METTSTTNPGINLARQLPPELVEQALALIHPANNIALIAHERPDGDCLGAILGMAQMLRLLGKTCVPVCADPAPKNLNFLPGISELRHDLDPEDFELVIALDAGELSRFGSIATRHQDYFTRVPILNLDHHISSSGCGQVNIIDPTAASTTELLVLFQRQAGLPVDKHAATCLLTGMITDTRSYQFTNTTPRTMTAAAAMLQAGAVPDEIVRPLLYSRPLAEIRFQGNVLSRAKVSSDGRLIWSASTRALLEASGATPDMDDNLAGQLRDIEGVQIAVIFKNVDDPNITRISVRTAPPYNAAELCQRLGQGGGHARAAGATLHMPLAEAEAYVIPEIEKELASQSLR
ncbi:MAG TPA: DHH family phosphoesterase [Ktedonobacteraceae bacterium]|nr:DHH family phosphoesterase [Ktedonobacteraceae bacterium]